MDKETRDEETGEKTFFSSSPRPPIPLSISYRDATNDDISALANVIARAFEEHRGSSSLDKTPESVRAELRTAKAVVAIKGDAIVGCVFHSVKEEFVYLAHLAVLPEYRGMGIAKALMLDVEKRILEQGYTTLRLSVRLALEKTRVFYEGMGYTFHSYGAHPGFTGLTYLNLQKNL